MIRNQRPSVAVKKTVSNGSVHLLLDSFARLLSADLKVHSGDRDQIVNHNKKSLHLHHRAADFHVIGMKDRTAFHRLWLGREQLHKSVIERYELIYHGPFTGTEAEHLHIGNHTWLKAERLGAGIEFKVEGVTAKSRKNHYEPYDGSFGK